MHEVIVVAKSKNSFAKFAKSLQSQTDQIILWSTDQTIFQLGDVRYYCVTDILNLKKLNDYNQADVVFFGSYAVWKSIPGIEQLQELAKRRQGREVYQKLSLVEKPISFQTHSELLDFARQALQRIAIAYGYAKQNNCIELSLRHCSEEARKVLAKFEKLPIGIQKIKN